MDWEKSSEIVYTTDSELRRPREFLSRLVKDISGSWELTRSLLVRNIKGQYRQTALGYLWAFIPPVATTLTFVFLQSQNIISSGQTDIPYPVYVLVGTLLWQVFVDAMNSPLRLMHASTSMMACVNFPREAILFAGLGEVIFYFAIRVSLLLFVFVFFDVKLSLYIIFFPLGVLSIMALGWGIGLLAVPVGLLYKDVEMGMGVLTTIWFFATPVVYTSPVSGPISILVRINPVTSLLTTTRQLLVGGELTSFVSFLCISIFSLCFLLFGWIIFRLAIPYLVKVINA